MSERKPPLSSNTPRQMRYAIRGDRMPPIPAEQMTEAQKKVAAEIAAGPRGRVEGPYWPILRSPGFAGCIQNVGAYFRYHCTLERRLNEMAALIAARSWSQQFVWDVHILQALDAGLKAEIAQAIAEGRRPGGMDEQEATLWDVCAELLATKGLSDPTYAKAVAAFGESGVIDVLGILGYYSTLAMIMNVARTPAPKDGPAPLEPRP